MNKSIIVIDTPADCSKCNLRYDSYGQCEVCILANDVIDNFYEANTKPTWCPLRPLPERKDLTQYIMRGDAKSLTHGMMYMYNQGYNECLDDIQEENK